MNKLTSFITGSIVLAGLALSATPALAASDYRNGHTVSEVKCGKVDVVYSRNLDTDGDGLACEQQIIGTTPDSSAPAGNGSVAIPVPVPPSNTAVTPDQQSTQQASGSDTQQPTKLAETGFEWFWALIAIVLITGGAALLKLNRKTVS